MKTYRVRFTQNDQAKEVVGKLTFEDNLYKIQNQFGTIFIKESELIDKVLIEDKKKKTDRRIPKRKDSVLKGIDNNDNDGITSLFRVGRS